MAGIFKNLKENQPGVKTQKAPSLQRETDLFLSTLLVEDLARNNLFLVRMEPHQSYSTIETATGGASLNGLSEVIPLTTGLLANEDPEALLRFLNEENSSSKDSLVRTGYADYNDNDIGISKGDVKIDKFDPTKTMGLYAEAVTLPSVTADVRKEHMQYQRKNLLMTSKDHSGLSITFRCSSNYTEYKYLRWLVDQKLDNKTNTVDFPDNFLLPQINVYIYNRETSAVATAIHNKCIITSISALEFSYESNNEVAKFTAEFMPEDIKFQTYSPKVAATAKRDDRTGIYN